MKIWKIIFVWPSRETRSGKQCSCKKIIAKYKFQAIKMAKKSLTKLYGKQSFRVESAYCVI